MLVSVIVPCRNEAGYIEGFLSCALSQSLPAGHRIEILVAGGASDDGTREILGRASALELIEIIDNPERIVATGLNRAIARSRGEVIVRMDVHTTYANDYVAECLEALESSGADNVGGPWRASGAGGVSDAIALAFPSSFACGGGKAHDPSYEGDVDTVYLGCWRRESLKRFGLFDEQMVRTQDSELNDRIRRLGGRVFQTPRIRSWYSCRRSLSGLWRQYVQYGYWKVFLMRRLGRPTTLRQLAPAVFLLGLTLFAAAAPWLDAAARLFVGTAAAYLAACLGVGGELCLRARRPELLPHMPAVLACYHFAYGWGYLRGAFELLLLRREPAAKLQALTREPA